MNAPARWSPVQLVVAGGLIAGACDITYACLYWWLKAGVPPTRVCQSVAAGVLGKASAQGGLPTAALGLCLHFFIALSMAFVYYLLARKWPLLVQRPVLLGALYGAFLYAFMNYVVVPLSAAGGGGKTDSLWVVLSIAVHMFLIGVPIGLFSGRATGSTHP